MINPGEALRSTGHDVTVVRPGERHVRLVMEGDVVKDAIIDTDVVVLQRTTHAYMAQAVPVLRSKGIAVVIDIDDDLTAVHPQNPAWHSLYPKNRSLHSWRHLSAACRDATLVTVSAPALLPIYAPHGRGVVLPNYLPKSYFGLSHEDSETIGWPASLHSHPTDPQAVGGTVSRLVGEGATFHTLGGSQGADKAFGLLEDPEQGSVPIADWPAAVARLGIGIAPLVDSRFNRSKSWLKPLELSACGVPWVASPRAEYARLHQMGVGVLAERPRAWYRELKRFLDSPTLRAEQSEAGRAVAAQLRIADHAWKWWEAWERARAIQTGSHVPASAVL